MTARTVTKAISRETTRALIRSAVFLTARDPISPAAGGAASCRSATAANRLAEMPRKRILSGMRPTGRFHLGNYLGAIVNWVRLQDEYECFYSIVDYHALTTLPDAHEFQKDVWSMAADLLAVGIDPRRSVLYLQSAVPEVAELTLLLAMITPLSWVQRTPSFKEKVRQQPENVNLGLLEYPVLQAADVLMFKADAVPVGKDQAAHLELIREITRRFNRIYDRAVFPEPQALFTDAPLVKGTDGKAKMSKSLGNHVGVTDPPEVIRKQVLSMVTDVRRVYMNQPGHPRSCNVCALYKVFFPEDWQSYWDKCRRAEIGCHEKKQILAERIIAVFEPFRRARAELSPGVVAGVLAEGAERAREVAVRTVAEAREAVGLIGPGSKPALD
jgi:tryptophanyl-tRNA synthetase